MDGGGWEKWIEGGERSEWMEVKRGGGSGVARGG